jgi:hypothetical protein
MKELTYKFPFSDEARPRVSTEGAYIRALENRAESIKEVRDFMLCSVGGNVYEVLVFYETPLHGVISVSMWIID